MGPIEFWSGAFELFKKSERKPLKHFSGKCIGVDASIWLHALCKRESIHNCLMSKPPYPPLGLLTEFQERHNELIAEGIIPYYVFDGCRHPMKEPT